MASIVGVGMSLSTPSSTFLLSSKPKMKLACINNHQSSWMMTMKRSGRMMMVRPVAAVPDGLQKKVVESIKAAEETCSDDPVSGECVAAWDEVEELSAAASHARDKNKVSDPLEEYCKDNMDTQECRTYDD